MACGVPVVAYARGSIPEIIKDGETGFLVNPSDNDIRGEFLIKKTGIQGLKETVEKIYSMSEDEYITMRKAVVSILKTFFRRTNTGSVFRGL